MADNTVHSYKFHRRPIWAAFIDYDVLLVLFHAVFLVLTSFADRNVLILNSMA